MSGISDQDYQTLVEDFNAKNDISLLGNRLDRLFEKVVDTFPHNVALIHDENEICFKELNASANLLARSLKERGLGHGDVIGLAVSRSINLVTVMLAVLKLGAAYVPIDPSFPAKRIDQMIEDANCKLILLSDGLLAEGAFARWKDLCLSVEMATKSSITDATNLGTEIKPQELAYIIYTSGSTGRPKGVEISHGAAANFLGSLRKYEPGCNEYDRLLAITTISFDMSALELLLPLLSGSTMIIANASVVRDPYELLSLIQSQQVTMLQATPATWTMLLESGWNGKPRIAKIICGGEPLSRQLADRLIACADTVWNVYGPSETTYGSVGRVEEGEIVVGNPVVNGRIYVLDEDMLPVPMSHEGEVYIGGGSVSNGYRNKAELTNSRFLSNPFHGGKFFRTGDLARFIGPGNLQVIGRSDGVVKIRGNRIDVGEIEAVLVEHPNVSEAIAVSRDERLVAYCVVHLPPNTSASVDSILRPWVAERLPLYMVPTFIVPIDALPLSPNQKVNRKALPDPVTAIHRHLTLQPMSNLERQIWTIWSEILGHDRIRVEDNFFGIGGDSVRIFRMQVALEKLLGRPVPTPKLFEHYTIKELAAYLAGAGMESRNQESYVVDRGLTSDDDEDIAVVSMVCRLPGGVATPEDLWQILQCGRDTITDVPMDRWDAQKLYHVDPDVDGTSYCRRGGFIDSIYSYDTSFFGISPREAQAMDPAHYLMLELCWEGFERAGYTKNRLSGSNTGVFLGVSHNGATNRMPPDLKGHSISGSASATMSGRLSYSLNLHGPSLTVDTACSSSLVATHLACNALRQGECNIALAGGISLLLTPGIYIEFSKLRGLSADGRCKAFSDDTDGTGFSEGAAVVVLKRLSDAQRDGDDIHAVLRGSAVMHGGSSAGLTVPNGPGQEALVRTALARARMKPDEIDYVEAHGTATKLGDPIEVTSLAKVFGTSRQTSNPLWLGSAKSNIGHIQAAAGLVGLLKVVLSFQNNVLPQTLHVSEPTKAVDWKSSNMELVLANQSWSPSKSRLRRAGVSAFGLGGTNAHIVEESPRIAKEETGETMQPAGPTTVLFVLSGKSDSAVRAQAEKLRLHIDSGAGKDYRLNDIAYSLAISRTHFEHRLMMTARDKLHLLEKLASVSLGTGSLLNVNEAGNASLGMLFTGQGGLQPGTGKELYAVYPVFRDTLDKIAARFTELEFPLLDVMWPKPGSATDSLLYQTEYAQPALFALEVSLWRLWQSWGVKPAFLLGHSAGELTVAHVSGILDLTDACRLVMSRGRLMQAIPYHGRMASVEISSAEVTAAFRELSVSENVEIACYNSPSQTVISGDVDAVDAVVVHMTELGRKTKVLDTSHAFHSFHLDEMLDNFRSVAQSIHFSPPVFPIISSMTGRLAAPGELEQAEYWVQQARNAVRFSDAFQTMINLGANVFLELGHIPALCGLGVACLADASQGSSALWLPSLKPGMDETSVIQSTIGSLHVRNVSVDWEAYFKPFNCQMVRLPTYAFQRKTFQPASKAGWFGGVSQTIEPDQGAEGVDKMMFELNWRPFDTAKAQLPRGSWGLFCPLENTVWMTEIQKALSKTGIQLVPVERLQDAEQLDGLLTLWDSAEADEVVQMAHNFTAKALAQLQELIRTDLAVQVVWITRLAVGTGHDDRPVQIGAGPLWGLMRTARSEDPRLRLRLIDTDDEVTDVANTLALALMLDDDLSEIAIRKQQLLIPHLERASFAAWLPIPSLKPLLRVDGAVLIVGGLGDLAGHIARRLVSYHGVRDLVLTSRRGMDSPGADALVSQLAKLGAKTTIVGGDIADFESLRSSMKYFTADRPLRGVIHAAGVVDSGVLSSLTPQNFVTTFAPKVDGLWNLHLLTKDNADVDLFVMLSSISGVIGLPGLGNYAAANSFIDVLAHLRRAQRLPATSMAYGTWAGNGMVTTLVPATRVHLSRLGLGFLSPEAGLELLERAVYGGRVLTVAASLDLERLKAYFTNQNGVPSFLRSMLGQSDVMEPVDRTLTLSDTLANAATEQHGSIMLRMVQATIAEALGHAFADELDPSRPVEEFGIDSLTAVLIRNHLATMTGMPLPPNIAILHPNLRSLSEYLLSQLPGNIGSDSSVASADVATPTTTASSIASYVDMSAVRRGVLSPGIQFNNIDNGASDHFGPPKTVLVTGPTGFVGAFMVNELLSREIDVYCLVRASGSHEAKDRMVTVLEQYGLWKPDYEPLLKVMVGDLSQPLLGLGEAVFDDLAHQVEAIVHSGALVDWMRPFEEYVGPNIFGTHEVLRLASCGHSKGVHFISTISTLPIHLGYGLTEHDGEYGYGTSKYLAERMIVAARFRGARASTYRLPLITASTANGRFRLDRGDFLHNLITGSLDLGAFPSIKADLTAVLPVDYLCSTIATVIIDDQQRIGEDYDFISPKAPTFDHFFNVMSSASGGKEILPFSEWHRRALEYAALHPKSPLARITTILDGFTDETAGDLVKGLPVGKNVFGLDCYQAPLFDKVFIDRYLECILRIEG